MTVRPKRRYGPYRRPAERPTAQRRPRYGWVGLGSPVVWLVLWILAFWRGFFPDLTLALLSLIGLLVISATYLAMARPWERRPPT